MKKHTVTPLRRACAKRKPNPTYRQITPELVVDDRRQQIQEEIKS